MAPLGLKDSSFRRLDRKPSGKINKDTFLNIELKPTALFVFRFKRLRLAEQLQRRSDSLVNIEDGERETEGK